MCVPGSGGDQKRVLMSLELELQMIVSHHVCVGMEPWSSGRSASALDYWVIALAPDIWLGIEGMIMSKC